MLFGRKIVPDSYLTLWRIRSKNIEGGGEIIIREECRNVITYIQKYFQTVPTKEPPGEEGIGSQDFILAAGYTLSPSELDLSTFPPVQLSCALPVLKQSDAHAGKV